MTMTFGPREVQLLAYAQGEGRSALKAGELVSALGWTVEQERRTLSRLTRKGTIARVRPGFYLVPPRLPPGGRWGPGEALALTTLMEDRGGRYQISGPNAFHRYGWTDQVPNRLYVYNDRLSGDRRIGTVELTLIKVARDRLGGTEIARAPEGVEVVYASKARALVDAVQDWSRFGTLPEAFAWIRNELEADDRMPADLVWMTTEHGNQGTVRRIGAFLERLKVQEGLLRRLEARLRPSSSFIPWSPTSAKRGKINRRWGVVFNVEDF